ncbi:MAG: AMP-binding protein [Bacteroidales bacterium]|nr:AMP-binding protein [Bacteroidales bacterium]MDY5356366.1 AMP-binding protein [Candidatus Cryptobacteroides sp.]
MEFSSVNKLYEKAFKENWDRPAISNYQGVTLHYRDVARRIEKLHIVFEECGLQKGDKVALCSRNQANWAVAFLAAMTYGAVPVPLLHEFKSSNVHHLVNHSEAKILFVDDVVWEGLNESEMPDLAAIIQVNTFKLLLARDERITHAREHLNEMFGKKYPEAFTKDTLNYYEDSADELAVINYTSGTSGFSKGVMIPYRAIYSNIEFAKGVLPNLDCTKSVVSMLPSAHMYGLMFEVLYELSVGAHVHFLSRVPSPKIIMQALAEVKPYIVIAVPLVIEKIYKSKVKPVLEKEGIRFLMKLPVLNQVVMNKIRTELVNAFGGQFEEVIIGGAAFNKEVEAFFKKINFPFTVGYGMTECAPIITYDDWKDEKLYSCGKVAPNLEIKVDSSDPRNIPGEVLVKGENVFLGYYKNQEATESALTHDGWFHTGDMGIIDEDGSLFLKGRSKCMILGPSGQNIYPEEIETVINSRPYVVESLVVEDNGGLTALVYPDFALGAKDGMSQDALIKYFEDSLGDLNKELPNYARIKKIEVMSEDFERTPKKSIKRYLYQRS